jgi:hypothetical protein
MSDFIAAALLSWRIVLVTALVVAGARSLAAADETPKVESEIIQGAAPDASAVRYGDAIATRYRVGAKIAAKGGSVQNVLVMVAVPLECPEQEVHVVEEDFSPHIESVEFRQLPTDKRAEPGARQMLITISELPPRQEAHALITYEVVTKAALPPLDTASLKAPAKPDRLLKPYLVASPFINVNHRKIRDAVKEALAAPKKEEDPTAATSTESSDSADESSPGYEDVGPAVEQLDAEERQAVPSPTETTPSKTADEDDSLQGVDADASFAPAASGETAPPSEAPTGDWQRVEALYDYVIEHVKYQEGAQDKSALDALQDGLGDCHGISALFVAMCRTAKIPARMVWVDGHQYAEFHLVDAAGKGHWYPVQSAGTRAFGEMPTPKVILQKGDNFRVPERRRERLRYASDFTIFYSTPKSKPKITYIREQL